MFTASYSRKTLTCILAATALGAAACSSEETTEEASPSTTTITSAAEETTTSAAQEEATTETVTETQETDGGESTEAPGGGNGSGSEGMTREEFQGYMSEQMRGPANGVGGTLTVDGVESEVCVYGDGHGLNLVTAGANTSCEFAIAVFEAQTDGYNPTGDNIRDHLQPEIQVLSPVTDQEYTMNCANDERNFITCTGGDNAAVYMY